MRCLNCGSGDFSGKTCKRCGVTAAAPGTAEVRVAPLGRRLAASLIDGLTAALLFLLLFVLAALAPSVTASLATLVVYVVASLGYSLLLLHMLASQGQTVGKRVMGLRALDGDDFTSIGWWRAIVRQLVLAVTGAIIVGYLSPLFDGTGRRRGWHDLAAGTVVLDVRNGFDPFKPASTRPTAAASTPAGPRPVEPIAVTVGQASAPPSPWSSTDRSSSHRPLHTAAAAPEPPTAVRPVPDQRRSSTSAPSGQASAAPAPLESHRFRQDGPPAPAPRGLITSVPGFEAPPPSLPPVTPPALLDQTSAPPVSNEDDGLTRGIRTNGPFISPMVLEFENGSRHPIVSSALVGRSPDAADSESFGELIAVVDKGMSMSKTHFAISVDPTGAWITDRHSTNGTRIQPANGGMHACVPGVPVGVSRGDVVLAGDHRVHVT